MKYKYLKTGTLIVGLDDLGFTSKQSWLPARRPLSKHYDNLLLSQLRSIELSCGEECKLQRSPLRHFINPAFPPPYCD